MAYEEKLLTPAVVDALQKRDNTWVQTLDNKKPLSNAQLQSLRDECSRLGRMLSDEERIAILKRVQ